MTVGFNRIRSASDGSVLLLLMNIREFAVGDLVEMNMKSSLLAHEIRNFVHIYSPLRS
jgi:hypothetical protein